MVHPQQSPAILSLCSGMRGIERGLERVFGTVTTVAYVEIEAFVIENLLQLMETGVLDPAPVFSDVKAFTKIAHHFRNKIHILTAGYPCQPFSLAGERKGTDDPRHLFPFIYRIVEAARPLFCFFENVPGHISMGYDEVYRSLRDLGYVPESEIFSAAEAGATHQRERLFILAVRGDVLAHCQSERKQRLSERKQGQERSEPREGIYSDGESEGFGFFEKYFRTNSGSAPKEHSQSWRAGVLPNPISTGQGHGTDWTSGISGGTETVEHTTEQGHQEFGSGALSELPTESGAGMEHRPEQSGDGIPEGRLSTGLSGALESAGRGGGESRSVLGTGEQDGQRIELHSEHGTVANPVSVATEGVVGGLPEESRSIEREARERQRGGNESGNSNSAVAHTISDGSAAGISGPNFRQKGEPGEPFDISNKPGSWPKANSPEQRVEGHGREGQQESGVLSGEELPSRNGRGIYKFPAPPGIYQHQWEAPRTIESRLGCSINGYNFREDLLRMLGNGVVEDTAEIAWRVLSKKLSEL